MKRIETLVDQEVLTVGRLKTIVESLPDDMVVSDIYNGRLLEVTQVVIYDEDGEEMLVIG